MRKRTPKQLYNVSTRSHAAARLSRHLQALALPDAGAYRAWCRQQGFGLGRNKDWRRRLKERELAQRLSEAERLRQERLAHLRRLGLQTFEQYERWCAARDVRISLRKTRQELDEEVLILEREAGLARLARSAGLRKRPGQFFHAAMEGRVAHRDVSTEAEHAFLTFALTFHPKSQAIREALLRLLFRFGLECDDLLRSTVVPNVGERESNTLLGGLGRLAAHHAQWHRPPESWRPDYTSPRRRFGSFARHLLADYPVPAFFDVGWFKEDSQGGATEQEWFLHIGRGQNIRTAHLPFPLTKRAAHVLLTAPSDLVPIAALRWAQVLGMGGSTRLARAVLGSRLCEVQQDEPFWATVLLFFANNPMLDPARVGCIVDYLYNQRYVPQEIVGPGGHIEHSGPPQPALSMKGRSSTALLALVSEWHERLAHEKRPQREWKVSRFLEFSLCVRMPSGGEAIWTLQELLSSRELQAEGRYMHNCVATYAESCAGGASSIWSLRRRAPGDETARRVMTVEVDPGTGTIVQALGRYNRSPDEQGVPEALKSAADVLRHWAASQKLEISQHLW